MARDYSGRCGTCAFFIRLGENTEVFGECRLGCWPSPLQATSTCSHHKAIGERWSASVLRSAAHNRRQRGVAEPEERPYIPKELGIDMDQAEFREVLREVLLDELGVRDVQVGERWQGGELVLSPGKKDTQEKRVPLDHFFRKLVMVRDKLRVLEQKVNAHPKLSDSEKMQLQQYVTACYGSLTTFNLLFRDKDDQFVGASSREK